MFCDRTAQYVSELYNALVHQCLINDEGKNLSDNSRRVSVRKPRRLWWTGLLGFYKSVSSVLMRNFSNTLSNLRANFHRTAIYISYVCIHDNSMQCL